jgi:VWFA-related protein
MNRRLERTIGIHLFLFAALALGAVTLGAQEPPLPSGTPSFGASVDVRVVNVEAVVTGRDGERVHGLTAADFRLLVDGKETPIEYFSEIVEGASSPAASGAAPGGPEAAASPAPQGRSFLVFIDDLFSVAQQRDEVLRGIERDLDLLGPADRMAIVAFQDQRLDLLSGWTGDRKALAAALQAARRRPARGNAFQAERLTVKHDLEILSQAMADGDPSFSAGSLQYSGLGNLEPTATGPVSSPYVHSNLIKISRAAVAALRHLAPPEGRRMMLVLSGGWVEPQADIPVALEANRLGYTLYPVNVQGLDRMGIANDASDPGPSPRNGFVRSGWQQVVDDGLEFMARLTGGKAMLNSARLSALGRAVEDTGSYYWLGFTPQWRGDDRHHRITLEARRKGLAVRSRQGFPDPSRASEVAQVARTYLLAGGDPKTRKLVIETGKAVTKRSTVMVPVTVAVPVAELTPVQQREGWVVEANLAMYAVDEKDSSSDLVEVHLRLNLKEAPRPGAYARYRTTMKLRRLSGQRLVLTLRDPLGGGVIWGETRLEP